MRQRIPSLLICLALGITAAVLLDYYSARHAPLYRKLERLWAEDVERLEDSKKLPKEWHDIGEIEVTGGTPETREWLGRIQVPIKAKQGGKTKLEILVVAWEEDGKRGALVQYNFSDIASKEGRGELGRTYILAKPKSKDPLKALAEDFGL